MHNILLFIILFSLFSCSAEKPADTPQVQGTAGDGTAVQQPADGQQAPETAYSSSLRLSPLDATRNSNMTLFLEGYSLSDATIEWLVNGQTLVSGSSAELKASNTKKGDTVQAKAVFKDKEILSNIVRINNSPPEISRVKIMPEIFKAGDVLNVETEGSDADGDDVSIFFEWTRNGEPAGSSSHIEGQIKRGDKIDVKIRPFDGEAYGKTVVLHREILNFPPVLVYDNKFNFDGMVYSSQVKASDPDGDALTYSLKNAPAGMTIDQATGLIKWNVPADLTGKTTISVSVTDGHGGVAQQDYNFELTPAK